MAPSCKLIHLLAAIVGDRNSDRRIGTRIFSVKRKKVLRRNSRGSERGVSMMEILVAMSIFGITSVCIAKAFMFHLKSNTVSEQKTAAYQVAQRLLDQMRVEDPGSLPSSGSVTANVVSGSRTFVVTTSYCSRAVYCTTNTKYIALQINYKGQELYNVETVFAQLK